MTIRNHKSENAKRFGEIIRRLRDERRMSLGVLAHKAALNYRHMIVLERGDNIPTLQTVFDLANALGVKASAILAEMEAGTVFVSSRP